MNTRDINELKNKILENRIELSDTLSQFMEKCNNNFSVIAQWGGGPVGEKGEEGERGIPTKPKVPIHIWRDGIEYFGESTTPDGNFEINNYSEEDLKNNKYQEGHLIFLENAHVYILDIDNENNFTLKPKYMLALHSYNAGDIVDGKNAYVHIAYTKDLDNYEGFITDEELRDEPITTFNLTRGIDTYNINVNMPYMGIYSDNTQSSSSNPNRYTWVKIQGVGEKGEQGPQGPQGLPGEKGDKGDKGDGYTGHPYTIDLEGDMSTISIDIDRTRLYDNNDDNCECKVHAYYGNKNIKLNASDVTILLPNEYKYSNNDNTNIVLCTDNSKVGKIEKTQNGNDVIIKFTPDEYFVFPKKTITFSIHIETKVYDEDDLTDYEFVRDTVWMIKGIMSSFELKILPQYRTIKLFEDGKYYPETLKVNVYKIEDSQRSLFDFEQNQNFTLLYKNYDSNDWLIYPNDGVDTKDCSCLEFKVVRYYDSADSETHEEIWDYEDVWVVADGKSVHYYHADLGSVESIMVLTTGEKINIGTNEEPKYCAELRNESGYSITFEPKFYDGAEELEVENVNIGSNSGDDYYLNGTFVRTLEKEEIGDSNNITKYKLTITRVPYNVDMIPITINVVGKCNIYDESGNIIDYEYKNDSISFNVYISTLTNIYTLIPTTSVYNTSTGTNGDKIGCNVYKNNTLIPITDLNQNNLELKYVVRDGGTESKTPILYDEPLVYGDDDDSKEDEFTAKDVAIEFILTYENKEVSRTTVPLIKDGIDGRDGDSWQYIFCKSPRYPFNITGISNPTNWSDNDPTNPDNELLGNNGEKDDDWYDDHTGIDSVNKYEYQSYRKWDKINKCWGKYGEPTLYSNYSESGSGYSVMLSNPISVIPVGDNDWSVDENNSNQSDYTLVYLYNNTRDMSTDRSVSISLPNDYPFVEHFSISENENGIKKVIFTPIVNGNAFDFYSNTQYKLPITLTYILDEDFDSDNISDNFTTTINWTLSPMKGLNDVEVFVDKRIVNTSISPIHSLKVGYYLKSSNGSKKFIGNYDEDNNVYKIKLTDDIGNLPNINEITNWQNATYEFVKDGENKNCYVVLVESDGETIIDYVDVISINDGKDGENGKSAIHLELKQDYIALPSGVNGGCIHPDYNVETNPISTQIMLYNGDVLIEDYENIEYSFKINGEDTSDITCNEGNLNIPHTLITGDKTIECIATYNDSSFYKTLLIDLEETPYEIQLDTNILIRDKNTNTLKENILKARVKYWINGEWKNLQNGRLTANTINGNENLSFNTPNNGDIWILNFENTLLKTNTTDTEVRISYYDNNNNELSYEIIGIIDNGMDGQDGQDGISTFVSTIFTISKEKPNKPTGGTYENPVSDSSDWFESIPETNDDNYTYPLWSSTKRFASDGSLNNSDWTEPSQMTDSVDFEVIYSKFDPPTPPSIDNFSKNINGKINEKWLSENRDWSDEGDPQSIWMATTKMKAGKWFSWQMSKIKGEQGPQGPQGPQGETGESGKLGKVVYPAGLYNENKLYILDDVKTPYVIYSDDKYYMLKSVPDNKKYWAENRKYYNSTHIVSTGKDVYKYISLVPDDYNDSTRITINDYIQVTGCNNDNFNIKWDEKKPPLSTAIAHLTGTYKYIGQSYKYGNTSQIVGNVIWTLNPDKTEVILASKFLYSKDGTPENIIDNINDVYFSGKSPIDDENWEIFESFESIHAKIGIIDNGTIGSAVYSGDYMFSQQGVDDSGDISLNYQNFDSSDPFNIYNSFTPNICINFKTGEMWVNNGKMSFTNGSINLRGFIKKIECVIPVNMLEEYFDDKYTHTNGGITKSELDVSKIGSYIFFTNPIDSSYAAQPSTEDIFKYIYLPSNGNPYFNSLDENEKYIYITKLRSLIGNSIYIYNNWTIDPFTQQKFILGIGNGDKSTLINPGDVAKCDLIMDENSDEEKYIWDIKIKKSALSNNSGIISKPIKPNQTI